MSVPLSEKLFWIARLCGERGLREEAREALGMARRVCGKGSTRVKIEMFALVVAGIGWKSGVKFCERARMLQVKDA